MGYSIRKEDLLNVIANKVGGSPKTVEKYLKAIKETILEELEMNGRIYFEGFGEFNIKEAGGRDKKIRDISTGQVRVVYEKPRYDFRLIPSKTIKDDINVRGFKTKEITKRKRKRNEDIGVIKRPQKPKPTLEQDFCRLISKKTMGKEEE